MNEVAIFRGVRYYVLRGHEVVPVDQAIWAQRFEISNRRVAHTRAAGLEVSTVFLGLDHRHGGGGPPLVFETMIFGGALDGHQWRYATWAEAEAGHRAAVDIASRRSLLRFVLWYVGVRYHPKLWERWLRRIKRAIRRG